MITLNRLKVMEAIRSVSDEHKLSSPKIAEIMGVTQGTVRRWWGGVNQKLPTEQNCLLLMGHFGLSLEPFLDVELAQEAHSEEIDNLVNRIALLEEALVTTQTRLVDTIRERDEEIADLVHTKKLATDFLKQRNQEIEQLDLQIGQLKVNSDFAQRQKEVAEKRINSLIDINGKALEENGRLKLEYEAELDVKTELIWIHNDLAKTTEAKNQELQQAVLLLAQRPIWKRLFNLV